MERLMENEPIRNEKPLTNGHETLAIGNENARNEKPVMEMEMNSIIEMKMKTLIEMEMNQSLEMKK